MVLLSGTEDSLRIQALRDLREAIGGDPFDIQVFLAGETPPQEWIASAGTAPFLSERRTVIVRNLLRAGPPKDALPNPSEAFKGIPDSGRLILVVDEEGGDYSRQQTLAGHRTKWEEEIKKAGGRVEKFEVKDEKIAVELMAHAAELGKKLGAKAAALLIEMTGKSYGRAIDELEKVALFVGESETIREADIEECVIPAREWSVFKLADSILEGNAGLALSQLRTLEGTSTKAEAAAMQSIFPNLTRNLRALWQARACIEANASPENPPTALKEVLPEQGSITSMSDWQRRKAMAAARRLTFEQLGACFEIVARTDARLKGAEPGFSASDTLDRMVLEMVAVVRN